MVIQDTSCIIADHEGEAEAISHLGLAVVPLKIIKYKFEDRVSDTCIVCSEPLGPGETEYCKSCQELIKFGL